MPRAFLHLRKAPTGPRESVSQGLRAIGYAPHLKYRPDGTSRDLLVIWTLWRHTHRRIAADRHTKIGGTVLCMENAWMPGVGRARMWQLARRVGEGSGINGQGWFRVGGPERWWSWGVRLEPWRRDGRHVLVCAQRGVKDEDPEITHDSRWPDDVMKRIRALTDRPVLWRPHPGAPQRQSGVPGRPWPGLGILDAREPLADAMRGAWCMVVYSSTAATEAIVAGIPVLYDGPSIMCQELAGRLDDIDAPPTPDREPVLERLAWAQWTSAELQEAATWRRYLI